MLNRDKITFAYNKQTKQQIKSFLKEKHISKRMLAKIKYNGGQIKVNDIEQNVLYHLTYGDVLEITLPQELPNEKLPISNIPIEVVYEDEDYLIVNKPYGVATVPSGEHFYDTLVSRVKNYYVKNNSLHQSVHTITRLDKDTSGIVIFAKHSLAHHLLDLQLRDKTLIKKYYALVENSQNLQKQGEIIKPIGRSENSIIERKIDENGKFAHTRYIKTEEKNNLAIVDIELLTGRTHQIRVHFSSENSPLVGDDLYGGSLKLLKRQGLHCYQVEFVQPFTNQKQVIHIPLAQDIKEKFDEIQNT